MNNHLKILIIIACLALFIVAGNQSYNHAKTMAPSFSSQWIDATEWIKQSTPEDSVFAHWWDYGYYVQTGANRATLSDGGNAQPRINHYMGRYGLTAQNSTQALEFLKTYGVDYFLIVSSEIGIYTAYSSIGSDLAMDRYTYIPTFRASQNEVQETRDSLLYLYKGSFAFDEDFTYQGKLFPKNKAILAGIILPLKKVDQNQIEIQQPNAIIIHNNKRTDIPLECVYLGNKLTIFPAKGLPGCLRIIPFVTLENQEIIQEIQGVGLYLSPKVKRTMFAQLYLLNQQWPGFELVYSDENREHSLIYFRNSNKIIGPLKIWKINPPSNIKTRPELLNLSSPLVYQ